MDPAREAYADTGRRAHSPPRIVSVHFPKAAGASLRHQFAELIGDGLQLDYNHDPLTPSGGGEATFPEGKRIVHGHFRPQRYASTSAFLMTFLREPVDNLISIYFFWRAEATPGHELRARFLRERPSILEFAAYPRIRRLMSETYFGDFDMDRFDFIGFYESRDADVARLAADLDLPLTAAVYVNKTAESAERVAVRTDPETLARLRELLADDIAFYQRLRHVHDLQLFDAGLSLPRAGAPLGSNRSALTLRPSPSGELPFTGERYVPRISGNIEIEHKHRYLYALPYVEGKAVLDIASGEGYGSALLASKAASVVGVDVAPDAVTHAARKYRLDNLAFRVGSCSDIPILDGAVDVVVSFETIEHHDQHERMLAEIKRVLKPGGLVVISSPDKAIYSDKPSYHNPFHVRELYHDEFEGLFRARFKNVLGLGQKVIFGSGILPNGGETQPAAISLELDEGAPRPGLIEPIYNLVLASDAALPPAPTSFLDVGVDASDAVQAWKAAAEQKDAEIARTTSELMELRKEAAKLADENAQKDAEIAGTASELMELQKEAANLADEKKQARDSCDALATELRRQREDQTRLLATLKRADYDGRLPAKLTGLKCWIPGRGRNIRRRARDYRLIAASPLFDAGWYLAENPDVAVAKTDPVYHYLRYGAAEGRAPGPYFDGQAYLDGNREVAAAGMNALVHYLRHHGREPVSLPYSTKVTDFLRVKALAPQLAPLPKGKLSAARKAILIIAHEASRTGAPILAWNLVRELNKRYNIIVLLKHGGVLLPAFEGDAAVVICLPDNYPADNGIIYGLIKDIVAKYSPVYAIANSVETRYFVPSLERLGVPVIALVHEFSSYTRPRHTLLHLYTTASEIIFSARLVAEDSLKDYPQLAGRDFKILPQGPSQVPTRQSSDDSAPLDVIRETIRPPGHEDAFVVVGMGAIQIRKGVEFFVQCAAIVRRLSANRKFRFIWIGSSDYSDPLYLDFLNEQIARSRLGDSLVLVGECDNLSPIFDTADIFLLSSRLDPLPNVSLDAALKGVPVVCFHDASGMAEFLESDTTTAGLVVPYLDTAAAAKVISDLADDSERRAATSRAIRARAEAAFNMPGYVNTIDRLGMQSADAVHRTRRDRDVIARAKAFNADLFLGERARSELEATALLDYLNGSRLASPRGRAKAGLLLRRPLEGFHPLVYASDNREFDEATGEDPLAHFVRTGRPAGRWTHKVIEPPQPATRLRRVSGVALHGHFYYPELLDDFIDRLGTNVTTPRLFLTTDDDIKAEKLKETLSVRGIQQADVEVVPNRGRDIAPLLHLLEKGTFSEYEFVGHVHGKRSVHVEQNSANRWREFLWEHMVGGIIPMMDVILDSLSSDPTLGLVFPEDPHLLDWTDNREIAETLASRMGICDRLPNHFDFPMGTMFWARTAALRPLLALNLSWNDYPDEPLPKDGTILHAIERLLPFCAAKAGYGYATSYVRGSRR